MDQKGLTSSMTTQMMKDVETIRRGFPLGGRVSVTNLSRSTEWRKELQEYKMLEVVERTQTAGVILLPEVFMAMLKYMEELEAERDQSEMNLIITLREQMQDWKTGTELAEKAKERVRERRQEIREALNGSK